MSKGEFPPSAKPPVIVPPKYGPPLRPAPLIDGWTFVWAAAIVFGSAALLIGTTLVYGLVVFYQESHKPPRLLPQDCRTVLIDAAAMAQEMGGFTPKPDCEKIEITGAEEDILYTAHYVYLDPDDENAPRFFCAAIIARSRGDASHSKSAGDDLFESILKKKANLKYQERNDLFSWGDSSRVLISTENGEPAGVLFTGQKGCLMYFFFTEFGFDDKNSLARLLAPRLAEFEKYDEPP